MIGWPIFRFISFPLTFLFPGYRSFIAVVSEGSDDDFRWLCYWLVCAFLLLIEAAASFLLNTIPFYYELKCIFLLALQYDTAKLAAEIYNKFLGPAIKHYEPALDKFIASYSQQAEKIKHNAKAQVTQAAIKYTLNQ
ncbi:TB2/DP1, HVA22 family protein [Histomonas meleagridis]|uniref:TB2/DP1, HVA22 family protein n=1 Tax=Histomonas meleagridis TaxID=135588 RepID=UPI00355A1971|nr:TB2/DP1, HVA22 family protein [Histomonas meleagridis]KAH0803249.1 TB2/DP1, HVA22 family protein [Histomonas meleagridis]